MRTGRVLAFSAAAVGLLGLAVLAGLGAPNAPSPAVAGVLPGRRATVPALIAGGVLIGLCTVPCSGAVYLAVLSLLVAQPTALAGFGYLVLYNTMFVLPLVGILLLASARPALNRLARWNLRHREWLRLGLGTGVVLMGFATLAIV